MNDEATRERKLEERICCEDGCDRAAAQGDVRCELHVLRMGGTLHSKPGPKPLPVVDVPVLDAIAPMKAIQVAEPPKKRAVPRLAGAAVCQVFGLASVAAMIETVRFFHKDGGFLGFLPDLALFEVPFSNFANLYLPLVGWVLLTTAQGGLAWSGRRNAKRPWSRRAGTTLLVTGILTTLAAALAALPLLEMIF